MNLDRIVLRLERTESACVEVIVPADIPADILVETFRTFALAIGYHPDTVKDMFGDV